MEKMDKGTESLGYQMFREAWTKLLGGETVEEIIKECEKNRNRPELFRHDREIFAESDEDNDDTVVLSDDE